MSEQRKGLQLDYQGTIPTYRRYERRSKGVGSGKAILWTYSEKLEFSGFTSSEAESLDQGEIRELSAEEIRTDKLEPVSKGRFGSSPAIEDLLEDASSFLGRRDLACVTRFDRWGGLGADTSGDDIAQARIEEQTEIEEDEVLEVLKEQIAEINTGLIELRQRVAGTIAHMEAMDEAAKGGG